jgi:rRNA maturation RNase YbeY
MIIVNVFFTRPAGSIGKTLIEETVEAVLKKERRCNAFVNCIFLCDEDIRELNKRWLDHDYPTDVISFTMEEDPELEAELYIGLDTARRQAREFNVPVREEIARLVVHGMLHICGHSDADEAEKAEMRVLENRYLERFRNDGILRV